MANPVIACVVNPARKRSEPAWQLVQQHCAAMGFAPPQRFETTIESPGEEQARQALDAGADHIIVIGGDGTVRNVSNVLVHSGFSLGIVPAGTANIFHLNAVGKHRSLDQAVRTALLGSPTPVDTGIVTLSQAHGAESRQRFLVVVGAGYDATSLQRVSVPLKQWFGPLAYFAAGARELGSSLHTFRVHAGGNEESEVEAWSLLVGNCGRVPGGITVLPHASLQDGLLNTRILAPRSLWHWVPIAWRALRDTSKPEHMWDSMIKDITIIPASAIPVQVDGDVWTDVDRIDIEVDPGSLIVKSRMVGDE